MRFLQFISEDAYRPSALDTDGFIKWCEENSSQFLKNKTTIFRGMDPGVALGTIDTNNFNRTSKNTYNFYTMWMDNHPSWKAYPKRSKSYICTTNSEIASGFGEIYLIIPEDDAHIGECSDDDLWGSFEYLFAKWHINKRHTTMEDVTIILADILTHFGDEDLKSEKNYALLQKYLRMLDIDAINRLMKKDIVKTSAMYVSQIVNDSTFETLYDALVDLMDPVKNNFIHDRASQFKSWTGHECWVQGRCAVAHVEHVDKDPKLKEFITAHFDVPHLRG